ncbi:hypothetical protein VPNG_05923 [Cytospora leucostoma]|uniref:Uncharacterized protein n=1 Tax=Cytospora leucostoma TaxID=1230097 RepID=A0A423XAT2_9PEZI|nr:hypothetical protein VPNG_05923 [Cytospora leucostoma]
MGPNDLLDYFIALISSKWSESKTTQDLKHVPVEVSILPSSDEVIVYSPRKICLYKFRIGHVPKEIVQKLENLAIAQDFGVGSFGQLCEVLKKTVLDKAISENPEDEYGKGVEGVVAMLAKLAMQVGLFNGSDYTMVNDTKQTKVHVVLVDGLGESHRYSHRLHAGADLKSFLEDMDKNFSKYCDPYNEWAYKNWDMRIQSLKKQGLDEDPSLSRINGLIALHKATKKNGLPQWMYYTILKGGVKGEEVDIQDEESFKYMMDRASHPDAPACLMRIAEARFRNIFVELRFLEEKQLALAWIQETGCVPLDTKTDGDGLQKPGESIEKNDKDGDDDFSFDPVSCYSLSYFYNLDQDNPRYSEGQQNDDLLGDLSTLTPPGQD